MHALDTHTIVDVVTLLLAVGGSVSRVYRNLHDRIEILERASAIYETALKRAGLL